MGKQKDQAIKHDNNMVIWDKVATTDPDHTKPVEYGRKFTAIDAHYQVMNATAQFGPVGAGWGYNTVYDVIHFDDGSSMAVCDLTFWWRADDEWESIPMKSPQLQYGPVRGSAMLRRAKKTPDTDAFKKAMTDALTKCLSHLGFNADVFLGKFDDNKYVQELRKDKDAELSAAAQEYEQTRKGFVDKIKAAATVADCDAVLADYKLWIDRLNPGKGAEIRAWVEKQKTEKGK
jgi:hypothetical protein